MTTHDEEGRAIMDAHRSLESRVFQPKLRMYYNGSTEVNVVRAELSASVAIAAEEPAAPAAEVRVTESRAVEDVVGPREAWSRGLSDEVLVSVFCDLTNEAQPDFVMPPGVDPRSVVKRGNIAVADVPLARLPEFDERSEVAHVSLGEPLAAPQPRTATGAVRTPAKDRWNFGSRARHGDGKSVLIGLIDVHGFDFGHEDFIDSRGQTRFVRIWDQGGDARAAPEMFRYGAEFRQEHLNKALVDAKRHKIPASELEPQSQMAERSHGTHVASIAAGNRGVCSSASIAGVVISLPAEDDDRRKAFYDSTRIAHAVDYLIDVATELGRPISINISLGTNGHAHDSSSAISRWIDAALAVPGRSVTVAAGNAGQEAAASADDYGYTMGRIHTRGRIASRGLDSVIDWIVVGDGVSDLSENELEIWYSAQDRFSVDVRPPGGDWMGPIAPGEFVENRQLPKPQRGFVSIYNELYHPINGYNYMAIYLSPFLNPQGVIGVPPGRWQVRLHGLEVRDGTYHGWIERDDPRRIGRLGPSEAWSFPSFLGDASFVDDATVSSLACGHRIISVANYDDQRGRINVTSSQGPTRDGRFKPDIAAPGTEIVAARGFATGNERWVAMSGTSMAAPYAAGVAGLMLATNGDLTAAQILGIMQSTARPLPGVDYVWRNDAGFGVIDPDACLREAAMAGVRKDRTRQ
jgi:subtilisin family serine protease